MSDVDDAGVVPLAIVNASPTVYDSGEEDVPPLADEDSDALRSDIYSIIRRIHDPEHPHTLEQLRVVSLSGIHIGETDRSVGITLIPTVPHCSLTLTIGLAVRVAVEEQYDRLKLTLTVPNDKHNAAAETTRQLNDKERCAAAMEIDALRQTVRRLITAATLCD